MPSEFHYTLQGQQMPTPVSAAELRRLAQSGQLQPTDMVWREGMANWVAAGSIKELFPPGKSSAVLPADKASAPAEKPPVPADKPAAPVREPTPPAPPRRLAELHPLLVLLLTLLTAGLFGLFYAFRVCLEFHDRNQKRQMDSAGRPLGTVRHPFWVLMLAYLTLGYYYYWWVYQVLRECSRYTGRTDYEARLELSLMLLFPPYALYVAIFRLPELIRRTQALASAPEASAVTHAYLFANPCMFCAAPFLGMAYQDALNQAWLTAP